MHIEKVFKNLIISQFALLLILVIYSIFSPVNDVFIGGFNKIISLSKFCDGGVSLNIFKEIYE